MKFKFYVFGLLLTVMLISCNNSKEEVNTENTEQNTADTSREIKKEISAIDRDNIIQNLQGEWKEPEYPFRLAHFRNTTVKFTEEGVVEAPTFQEYKISNVCPFEVNNIKNAMPNDIFLVMVKAGTCEILKVFNDTLTLSGFSINTNSDYKIIYKKVK